ncbi:hypothetical protein PIB30_092790, partial [Stylosanthes scabra]|nr:hypothetical protein [Stylosanthes scabra]
MEEQEDQEPPQEQAHQEQAGPSEQPSMRDLMQVLQRIEQNQESMNNRFQRFEETQSRMDRRIQRIERHMNVNEEENEDQ